MSMLAFFPWLHLSEDLEVDGIALLRFRRGVLPGGPDQAAIDSVLELYTVGAGVPAREATLLRLPERAVVFEDLPEDALDLPFELAELVAFSGLAQRTFFAGINYCNRATFSLVLQAFTSPADGVAVRSRRRDGYTRGFSTRASAVIREPHHVGGTSSTHIDVDLLRALLAARAESAWDDIEEAIFFFNQANTDSPDVSEQVEVIYSTGAFERLLECRGGKEAELTKKFSEAWLTRGSLLSTACARARGIEGKFRGQSIVVTWMQDFFRHRGNVSHGRRETAHPAIWTAQEHLLLSAFAFPLLLKMRLARLGTYAPTRGDLGDVHAFERLLCAELFRMVPEEAEAQAPESGDPEDAAPDPKDAATRKVWPWHEIRRKAHWESISEELWVQLNAEMTPEVEPDSDERPWPK